MVRGKPITDPERLEKAWQQAKASAEIEGHVFTPEDEKVIKAVASGKMTREELIEKLKRGEIMATATLIICGITVAINIVTLTILAKVRKEQATS